MAKRLIVTGRVQGVSYRASFEAQARALGLAGWVRNRNDGSVEALVAGDPDALLRIIAWARKGPSQAAVDHVEVIETSDAAVSSASFAIAPTV